MQEQGLLYEIKEKNKFKGVDKMIVIKAFKNYFDLPLRAEDKLVYHEKKMCSFLEFEDFN